MTEKRSLDAVATLGVITTFLGLWAIWPPIAVVAAGVTIVGVAAGLTVARARRDKPGGEG